MPRDCVGSCYRSVTKGLAGNWLGSIPIPNSSLEERVTHLEGDDKQLRLGFARRILRWLPDERPIAEELAFDAWLMQRYTESKS